MFHRKCCAFTVNPVYHSKYCVLHYDVICTQKWCVQRFVQRKSSQTQRHRHLHVSLKRPGSFPRVTSRGPPSWFPSLWFGGLGGATTSSLGSALLARPASLASQRSQTNPGVFIVLSHCNTPHPSLLLPPPPNPNPPPHFSSAGDRRLLWHFLRQRLQQQGKWWRRHQLFNGNSIMFTLWRVRATPPLPPGERRRASVLADCWCQRYSNRGSQSEPADARHASWLQPTTHPLSATHPSPNIHPPTPVYPQLSPLPSKISSIFPTSWWYTLIL